MPIFILTLETKNFNYMKKINCTYCGSLNFERVSVCFNCRKSVLPTSISKSNRKLNSISPIQSSNSKNTAKIIINITIILAIGVGVLFGYQKYAKFAKDRAEAEEIKQFTKLAFKNDPTSLDSNLKKLPTAFRVNLPDLDLLNTFPFKEKMVVKFAPKPYQVDVWQDHHTEIDFYGRVNNSGPRVTTQTAYSSRLQRKVLSAQYIAGYRFSKNLKNQLVLDLRVIVKVETLEERKDLCVNCQQIVRQTKLDRTNGNWEIISVKMEEKPIIGQVNLNLGIPGWVKGQEEIKQNPYPDLIATQDTGHYNLDREPFGREPDFYSK